MSGDAASPAVAGEDFEAHRQHLLAVAFRILRDPGEAEDVVQEAWIRQRSAGVTIQNPAGWLTTCVTRLCLDRLRGRRPESLEDVAAAGLADPSALAPDDAALLAADVSQALTVVMDSLPPTQRVCLVLHDVFGFGFDEVGEVLAVRSDTARRLASRARARVRGQVTGWPPARVSSTSRAAAVSAFLAAARTGDVEALVAVLAPDVVRTADPQALPRGSALVVRGAEAVVAETRGLRANAERARVAVLDGEPVLVVGDVEHPELVLRFAVDAGRITHYDVVADSGRLGRLAGRLGAVPS